MRRFGLILAVLVGVVLVTTAVVGAVSPSALGTPITKDGVTATVLAPTDPAHSVSVVVTNNRATAVSHVGVILTDASGACIYGLEDGSYSLTQPGATRTFTFTFGTWSLKTPWHNLTTAQTVEVQVSYVSGNLQSFTIGPWYWPATP